MGTSVCVGTLPPARVRRHMRRLAEADVCAAFVELLMPVLGNGFYSEFFRQIATAIAEKICRCLASGNFAHSGKDRASDLKIWDAAKDGFAGEQ